MIHDIKLYQRQRGGRRVGQMNLYPVNHFAIESAVVGLVMNRPEDDSGQAEAVEGGCQRVSVYPVGCKGLKGCGITHPYADGI